MWRLIGDTGDYTTASLVPLVPGPRQPHRLRRRPGETFRAYCSFGCSHGASGEYVDITVDSATPAAPPVDTGRRYRIAAGTGRILAQAAGGSAVTSVARPTGSARESWSFTPTGDGAFTLVTPRPAGCWASTPRGRTAGPGAPGPAGAARAGGPTLGQQWFVIPGSSAAGGHRLVNCYSGLVLGLSATTGRLAGDPPVAHLDGHHRQPQSAPAAPRPNRR